MRPPAGARRCVYRVQNTGSVLSGPHLPGLRPAPDHPALARPVPVHLTATRRVVLQAGSAGATRSWLRLRSMRLARCLMVRMHDHRTIHAAAARIQHRLPDRGRHPEFERQIAHVDVGRLYPAGDGQRPVSGIDPHGDRLAEFRRPALSLPSPHAARLRQPSPRRLSGPPDRNGRFRQHPGGRVSRSGRWTIPRIRSTSCTLN